MNTQTLGALAAELEAMHDMRFRVHARLLHEGIGGIEMTAKQTPLVDILRLHAEDLYSDYGHNKSARLLSQAADEIERLRSNALALEDEKNDYMDGVGDVLGQDHDGETLWAAAQRVMSECDRLRTELAKADGQINRCVEQNKYLESTISRLSEHLDCMIDYVCESNARYMVGALEAVREARKALEDGKP